MHTAQTDQAERGHEARWLAREDEGGDDRLSEDEALADAEDELDRDGYQLAWWLNNHAILDASGPADLGSVRERIDIGEPCSAAELLALAFNDADCAVYCLHLLREQFRAHAETRELVKARAAEILAEQDEGAHFDRMARFYLEAA